MRTTFCLFIAAILSTLAAAAAQAQTALSTAFTYQGELASGGTPATGTYDILFRLFDAAADGTQIGTTLCSDNLTVASGRFAATLDFGSAAFTGQKRFLQIEVRQDTGLDCSDATGYELLTPRQELTAAPNATFAQTAASAATATTAATATNALSLNGQSPSFYQNAANLTGTLADVQLSSNIARLDGNQTFTGQLSLTNAGNTFAGNGAGLTNLSGASITAGTLVRSSLTADVQSGVGTVAPELSPSGSIATGTNPISVAVSGSFAYVVNRISNTLQVFNISNPAVPTLAGSVATASDPRSVAVSGSFAYVVNRVSNTMQVFNISNPAAPTLAGSVATNITPFSVAVLGSFAHVVNRDTNTLQVFNISNPAAPALAGSVATGNFPVSVAVSGSFAYVVNRFSNTLQVFNVSSPAAPTLAGSVATGSQPSSVTVSGSFAYVVNANSNTLQVFDISNPAAITLAGSVATGIQPSSVTVSGSFAYVVNVNSDTLQAFNISNPGAPTLAGSVATGNGPQSVAVSGSFAYLVNESSNLLQVFNTSNRIGFSTTLAASSLSGVNGSGLTGVNAASLNGQAASFYTNASNVTTGTLANARTSGTNLSTPSTLVLRDASGNFSAGTITASLSGTASNATQLNGQAASFYTSASNITTGTLADARLTSNIARLNSNQTFTGLLNFTNASNTFAGNGAGLTNLSGGSIAAGTLARSALSTDVQSGVGTLVPDLSLAGSVATGTGPISVAVSGSFAYVANDSSNTLQVFDISNPGAPTLAGSVATGSQPFSVAVSGSLAYVVNRGSNTLQAFNISNPGAPTLAGSVPTGSQPFSVAVSGSLAYVVSFGSSTLQLFNISNPAAITVAGSIATGINPDSVAVSGSLAYVVNRSSNTLQIFNITNPGAPTLAGSVATGNQPSFVAVSGSFAYVVNFSSSTLQVFNISNPAAPTLAGSIATGNSPNSIAVSGSLAYVVNLNSSTLQVFNISNPAAPVLTESVATGGSPASIALSGPIAFVANRNSNTLEVFNTLAVGFGKPLAASSLVGVNGSGLTGVDAASLNGQPAAFYTSAANLTGTLPAAALSGVSGASLVSLSASAVTTGTLAEARLPTTVARENAANAFGNFTNTFAGDVGIGIAAPTSRLHIRGDGTGGRVVIDPGAANLDSEIGLYENTSNTFGAILRYNGSATNQLQIIGVSTGPTELLLASFDRDGAGSVNIPVTFSAAGKAFRIDHPLDPQNRELWHSCVESPDMMNIYNGMTTTDARGFAVVELPDYFEALNRDFRYHLTVVDDSENDFILTKVYREIGVDAPRQFTIKSSLPNIKVSWQVTGIRKDAWAEKNRIPNAVDKPAAEKGKLLHPEAFAK